MADTFLVIGTGPTVNIVLSGAGTPYTAGTGIAVSGANVISNTAPDQTVTMTDGTGIDVTGTYPNFTITNTSPNVVQNLSIAGQDLTLSGGGGTVEIPASDNIYTADGTLQASRTVNFDGHQLDLIGGPYTWAFDGGTENASAQFLSSQVAFSSGNIDRRTSAFVGNPDHLLFQKTNASRKVISFEITNTEAKFESDLAEWTGLHYAAYYPDIESSPQSFTDVQTVNSIKQKLATYTESERDAISGPVTGYVIFCTDATATDSSTGVMQVWNGATWKNAW